MERIGRYALGELLGAGGAGRVYRARLDGPGGVQREVALKLIAGDTGALEREARLGGLLRHVNLVDVYEVGEADGTWFCAMELCDGGALTDHLPLPPRAVVEVGLQVCDVLGYAHQELGLVHQDLKPDNLLLDGAVVKVADLGIASATGFDGDGRIRGTPGYMAPEQAAGGPVDGRTDVYALGVVLQELAGGQGSSASDTFSLDDVDEPFDGTRTEVPWLAPVTDRCLDPDPARRFPDMAALGRALQALDVEGAGLEEALGIDRQVEPEPRRQRTNLPSETDRFVGRQAELQALSEALVPGAVVVLKGPGGIGKTRLALAVARQELDRSGEEAWLCDLSGARDRDGLVRALGQALGVRVQGASDEARLRQVGTALAGHGSPVVVLDNFEQLRAHASVVDQLVELAPGARLLVTSREALPLKSAVLVDLDPLDPRAARELLVDRAGQRGADVSGDPAVEALAERLEGVPLALELAAGRLGVLSPAEVLDRLGLSLLRSGRSDVSDRQATLRATLAWSWDLLEPAEQRALAQVSVFRGGFTLGAAEAVVHCGEPVIGVVDRLVARSLLRAREGRLSMLESVRSFAAEHLEDPGPVEQRHGAWYARYGSREALDALNRHGGLSRQRALLADRENLRHAVGGALERRDVEVAVPTLLALWACIDRQGPYDLALELCQRVRALDLSDADDAWLTWVAAQASRRTGRMDDARALTDRAVALGEALDIPELQASSLLSRGILKLGAGDLKGAMDTTREALAIAVGHGLQVPVGSALTNLGQLALYAGELDEVRKMGERALAVHRQVGNRGSEGVTLGNLGLLYRRLGQTDAAVDALEAALAIHQETGDRRFEGVARGNLGALLSDIGDTEGALGHLRAAVELHVEQGNLAFAAQVQTNLGDALHGVGRIDEAREVFEASLARHEALDQAHWRGVVTGNLGLLALEQGDEEAAAARFEEARQIHGAIPDPIWEAIDRSYGALILLRRERFAEALPLLEEAAEALRGTHAHGLARVLIPLAEARAAVHGDLSLFEEARDRCEEGGWLRDLGLVHATWGRALVRAGDDEAGREHLQTARALRDQTSCLPTSALGQAVTGLENVLAEPPDA